MVCANPFKFAPIALAPAIRPTWARGALRVLALVAALGLAALNIVPSFAEPTRAPYSPLANPKNKQAIARMTDKLKNSKQPRDRDLAEILKAARIDLDAEPVRIEQARTKLMVTASFFEKEMKDQLKKLQTIYFEFFDGISGQPIDAVNAGYEIMKSNYLAASVDHLAHGLYSAQRSQLIDTASDIAQTAIKRLALGSKSADINKLQYLQSQLNTVILHWQELIVSIAERRETAESRARFFAMGVDRILHGRKFVTQGTTAALIGILRTESHSQSQRCWVNLETVSSAIFAASMVIGLGEAIIGVRLAAGAASAAGTAGAKAIATAAARRLAIQQSAKLLAKKIPNTVHSAARATALALTIQNLSNSFHKDGWGSFKSAGTWIEFLSFFALLPKPAAMALAARADAVALKQAVKAGETIGKGKLYFTYFKAELYKQVVIFQHQAGYTAAGIGVGLGVSQILMAESLAKDAAYNKKETDTESILKQGYANIFLGLFSGFTSYHDFKSRVAKNPKYGDLMSEGMAPATLNRLAAALNRLNILVPIRDLARNTVKITKGVRTQAEQKSFDRAQQKIPYLERKEKINPTDKPLASAPRNWVRMEGLIYAGGNMARILYDWTVMKALGLYFFVTTDSNPILKNGMEETSAPRPELKPGEIALGLTSFAPSDLLYGASRTSFNLKPEREKYRLGFNYFEDEFDTPAELLYKLELYGKKYGKIKYLILRMHGAPGLLATKAYSIELSGSSGIIDDQWLKKHQVEIQKIAKIAFSPDIRVRLWSCLVGGNPNQPILVGDKPVRRDEKTGKMVPASPGIWLQPGAGDRFVKSFGDTFMHQGGILDLSRRAVVASHTLYGQGYWRVLIESIKANPAARREYEDQVEKEMNTFLNTKIGKDTVQDYAYMTHVYEGFKDNLINLTKIINKYGIKVEDWGKNIFTDSHRQAVFRNQHLPIDISGNEAFWRLRSIDDQTSEKIRDLAKWASEVLGVPEIHNDIEKMAAAGDLMTSELGMDQSHQALTFNIPNRSPFILINTNRLPRAGKKNLSHLTPSDLQNRRHYEYIQRASAAALLAHEWTHTKQNYQYVFEHTDAQVEASAYKVERLFIEKLLELPENRDPKLQLKLKTLIEYDIEGTYLESYGTPLRASKKR